MIWAEKFHVLNCYRKCEYLWLRIDGTYIFCNQSDIYEELYLADNWSIVFQLKDYLKNVKCPKRNGAEKMTTAFETVT